MANITTMDPNSIFPADWLLKSSYDPVQFPLYHTSRPSLIPGFSDRYLALAVPVIAYWVLGSLFHFLDVMQIPYFEKRRIHESEEVLTRNRVKLGALIRAVLLQHFLQTILGLLWLEKDSVVLATQVYADHASIMATDYAPKVVTFTKVLIGPKNAEKLIRVAGKEIIEWVYWWGFPLCQFGFAFFIIDTHQFWLHKLMHDIPFLYRNFHSHHHRLYVPYAFGALYNHWLEGLMLDSVGAALAEAFTGMTVRQTILLFGFATCKTVDDHSGYKIWWDPLQLFFANNADYHDIHHQSFGIKYNFSQPFFTRWDAILGTMMTRQQANIRKPPKARAQAEIEEVEKRYKIE